MWILYDQGQLKAARQQAKRWYNAYDQTERVEQLFLNKLDYQFALGMIDLKDAKLDSAQIRLAVMQSYLSEFKHFDAKNQAAFHCQVLKAELLYQRENFQAAIEAAHEVTRIRQHGFG